MSARLAALLIGRAGHGRAEEEHHGGEVGGGVGVGEGAADGAAVAHGRIADLGHGFGQHRAEPPHVGGGGDLGVGGEGADYETGPDAHVSAEFARGTIETARRYVEVVAALLA